jgi:hypothetical protein
MEDSLQELKVGTVKIANLTGAEIIGSINGEIIKLATDQASESFKLNSNKRISLAFAAASATRHHLLYKNTLTLNSQARSLLILRPPKRSGSVKIQGQLLIEYPPFGKKR